MIEKEIAGADDGLKESTVEYGFSEAHLFSFDQQLYLKTKDVLKISIEGKLEILKDDTICRTKYCASANLSFPHLYRHGE